MPTEFQCANVFTKSLAQPKFEFLHCKLSLVSSPKYSLKRDVKSTSITSNSAIFEAAQIAKPEGSAEFKKTVAQQLQAAPSTLHCTCQNQSKQSLLGDQTELVK
ncbi:hypothetical protein ACOSP7_027336 [Xanthoceras sorbifolium]